MTEEDQNLKISAELIPDDKAKEEPREIPHSSFNPIWYLSHYADVRESGMDATDHYLEHGIYEGRHATEVSWRASLPLVEEDERRDLIKNVCRIVSGSDADNATVDRYYRSLTADLRNVVEIARELINVREITQRATELERKLKRERRAKMGFGEPGDGLEFPPQPARSPWASREAGKSRLGNEDLDLSNILDSRKILDMGEAQRRNGRTEDGPSDGQSLADLARSKRSAILNSI